jgi:hypothetical protein
MSAMESAKGPLATRQALRDQDLSIDSSGMWDDAASNGRPRDPGLTIRKLATKPGCEWGEARHGQGPVNRQAAFHCVEGRRSLQFAA